MLCTFLTILLFRPIFFSNSIHINSHLTFFNILIHDRIMLKIIKYIFIVTHVLSNFIIFFSWFSFLISRNEVKQSKFKVPVFGLLIGKDMHDNKIYLSEKGLYQNILVTGSIGSGKTASAMYPFTNQLIRYSCNDSNKKLGFLILDVKGNYYSKVLEFAKNCDRFDDVVVISVNGKYKYNPLNKPYLKSSVLANRIKTILLLFSPNNSESYWLDKVEQILECCINLCRVYNDYYVTFEEIHKVLTDNSYFSRVIKIARDKFVSGNLSRKDCYLLLNSILFLENDYFSLDSRTYNLLKSEITRITNFFVADYEINKTFCPTRENENFHGFKDVINNGKIVVLNMNISQYRNLSKIIAAYLKLDFQSEVLSQLSNNSSVRRPTVFISDEYQEYVTSSDADFFSQSREAKCINIVSTQSYTSILNTLNNPNASRVIIQSLINKLWFRTDDIFTIEEIQKQIGKEDKIKFSKTFSESAKESNYSVFSRDFISYNSGLSESINSYYQNDYVFDYNYFTQNLNTFSCLCFLSDGGKVMPPQPLHMLPYFLSNNHLSGGFNEQKK